MLDIALLRVVKYRTQYDKVHRYIPKSAMDKRTIALVGCIGKYFSAHPDDDFVKLRAFSSFFFNKWHRNLDSESVEYYNKVIANMKKDESEARTKTLINQLLELEFATHIGNAVTQYQQGEDIEIVQIVGEHCDSIKKTLERTNNFEFAQLDDELMQDDANGEGLPWHLPCLSSTMRNMRGGDFIIVAARPDAGKTTFLTDLLTNAASHTDKPIIWLNNESKANRILKRAIQSALGCTNSEMVLKQTNDTLFGEYTKVVGHKHAIQVFDIHGWDTGKVEELLDSKESSLVVFDMIDNVKFHGTRHEDRTDQMLEKMYQWARELSVHIDAPIIATSQVSTEGAGVQFPAQHMLKDSKTGKQGACDVILMIGKSDDPMLVNQRFLSVPKNKLKIEGSEELLQEVLFDRDRGKYVQR